MMELQALARSALGQGVVGPSQGLQHVGVCFCSEPSSVTAVSQISPLGRKGREGRECKWKKLFWGRFFLFFSSPRRV